MMSEFRFQFEFIFGILLFFFAPLKSNHVKCCDKQNIWHKFVGIFWGYKVIKHIKQTSVKQSGQIVGEYPNTHSYTHTHTHTYPFAIWSLNFVFMVYLFGFSSFYIIINQFDTFTSALKRKPQGFGFVAPKCLRSLFCFICIKVL